MVLNPYQPIQGRIPERIDHPSDSCLAASIKYQAGYSQSLWREESAEPWQTETIKGVREHHPHTEPECILEAQVAGAEAGAGSESQAALEWQGLDVAQMQLDEARHAHHRADNEQQNDTNKWEFDAKRKVD